MKKAIHILLALLFIYNIIGYFAVFQVLKYKAKQEIKKTIKTKIPDSALTIITVTSKTQNELNWIENGKEFIYHNMMFDIVRTEHKGSTTYYYCINDHQEKELFANLSEHIENYVKNDVTKSKKTKSVIQKVIKDYFFINKISVTCDIVKNIEYSKFSNPLLRNYPGYPTPPPKI